MTHKRLTALGAVASTFAALLVASPPAASSLPTQAVAKRSPWKPDLVERFDRLDTRRWNAWDHVTRSNENSYLLSRNVWVEDGKLRIQARRERMGGRDYTSGALDTYDHYSLPNYFRLVVRAKVPQEQGMFPAPVWLRPADLTLGSQGHEIDVVETIGREAEAGRARIHQTLHGEYDKPQHSSRSVSFARFGDRAGTRWHDYEVVKTRDRIVMKVDGVRTAVFTPRNVPWFRSSFERGTRWALRVNLQVGGKWAKLPGRETNWGPRKTSMYITEIRTWTRR